MTTADHKDRPSLRSRETRRRYLISPSAFIAACTAGRAQSSGAKASEMASSRLEADTGFGSAASGPYTVTVESGASVTGTNIGINLAAGSTVINSGTISTTSGTDAVQFHGTGNTLKLTPTSVINGIARGAGSDTFQLGGSGTGALDVSLINSTSQYRGFTTYQKVDDSLWVLTGTTTRVTHTIAFHCPCPDRRQASARASRWNWSQETGKALLEVGSAMRAPA